MSRGIVVDHKESGVRYAVSERNYNPKIHKRVRDLLPGETVLGYQPLRKEELGGAGSPSPTQDAAGDQGVVSSDSQDDTRTKTTTHNRAEGSTKDSKDSK